MEVKAFKEKREIQAEIEELIHAYVQCIDEDRLEEWPEFFAEDCLYQIISRENHQRNMPASIIYCDSKGMLKDRVTAHRQANIFESHVYRHLVSSIRIVDQERDGYMVHTNYAVFQTRMDGYSEVYNVGRYIDKVIFEGNRPKFKEKKVVYDSLVIPTLLVTPI
ncbi:aromatic-ring-hydroxylating dioxygenase subunit beta [Aneurinibacillus sp. Ricciae_BoGa-3]|uniref:aromatic-ring-hydroxylating dioxygenase subunit beta n=1 Tax=Aneurinibacillus sp. Ricciae_BoGa-3 TaxID=3022697 RepID=UPI0023423EF6|nr:aromatic-ring-hydroxylating dioxygenase subunit beta [Aneurinibacillus sp. Ricciae_BoGa-3]WCK56672.1 aromatic-ring-hydroxylating dioxygenase subunit beta [Aneurinibacillus sp. Ricciae_BoGa-3]